MQKQNRYINFYQLETLTIKAAKNKENAKKM